MIVSLLQPGTHLAVRVLAGDSVRFEVRSDPFPVVVHLVDDHNMRLFEDDEPYEYEGPEAPNVFHEFEEETRKKAWHLIVMNESEDPVAIGIDMRNTDDD